MKKNKKPHYILYTDGACENHSSDKEGAYAYIILDTQWNIVKKHAAAERYTTNNQMELLAIIEGCKCIEDGADVTVYTDSEYAIGVLSGKWRAKKNLNLIARHIPSKERLTIHYKWVKGHADDEYNLMCDKMANEELVNFINDTRPYINTVVPSAYAPPTFSPEPAPVSQGKRICRLSDEEYLIVKAFRDGLLKHRILIPKPPKVKRTPKTEEEKKDHKRAYYQANKEARKAYSAKYYQDHKDEYKIKNKEAYAKRKQHLQERSLSA